MTSAASRVVLFVRREVRLLTGDAVRIIEMSARMIRIVDNPILAVLLPVSCVVSISRRRD